MNVLFKLILIATITAIAAPALAKPVLSINLKAEMEIEEIVNGNKSVKIVPAEEISSGQTVIYTLEVTNSGDQTATKVKVTDPIPPEVTFIVGSAFGEGAEITYSIDGGKEYKKPSSLTSQVDLGNGKTESRVASPEMYSNIQWVLETVPVGSVRTVGFKALVK